MKKIIVILMLTGSFYAQDDIILKSAGTDASKGIVFQNSDADTLMDINGDGLISISGSLTVKVSRPGSLTVKVCGSLTVKVCSMFNALH